MGVVTVACPGTKSYEILPDYRIAVEGEIPVWDASTAAGKYKIAALKTILDMHGERILRYSNKYGFPATWTAGIIGIETVPPGNPNSCSPSREGGCGSGAACCAYGLMQFIKSTAQSYGLPGGEPLLGNAELATDLGVQELVKKSKRYGMDIVKIAGSYNAGSWICERSDNWFGNREESNYAEQVVRFANTARAMGYGILGPGPIQPQQDGAPVGPMITGVLGVGFLAASGYLYWKYGK